MITTLITDFTIPSFKKMFKQYFEELSIHVSDYETLFKSMNEEDKNIALLTFDEETPVGFLMFCIEHNNHWFLDQSYGFIREFWIHPNYRNKNYGKNLLRDTEEYLLQHYIFQVLLTTDTAEHFYLSNGYHISTSHTAVNEDLVFTKQLKKLEIKTTTVDDLESIRNLWNDGRVMKYVGFPVGLQIDKEDVSKWYSRILETKNTKHYSIYLNNIYVGESYYSVDENDYAALDIKLFEFSRGQNIAYIVLKHVIHCVFKNTNAKYVYVDPHPDNQKAWILYERLKFNQAKAPNHLDVASTYQEIKKEDFIKTEKGEIKNVYIL